MSENKKGNHEKKQSSKRNSPTEQAKTAIVSMSDSSPSTTKGLIDSSLTSASTPFLNIQCNQSAAAYYDRAIP